MLTTPLGNIEILIDGRSNSYKVKKLSNKKRNFTVNGRYMIIVDIPKYNDITVECKLSGFTGEDAKGGIESDERLALISFYHKNIKLSIGVEDEIPNVQCCYIDYGLKVIIAKEANVELVIFGIAWIAMKDKNIEDIYTVLAADPILY